MKKISNICRIADIFLQKEEPTYSNFYKQVQRDIISEDKVDLLFNNAKELNKYYYIEEKLIHSLYSDFKIDKLDTAIFNGKIREGIIYNYLFKVHQDEKEMQTMYRFSLFGNLLCVLHLTYIPSEERVSLLEFAMEMDSPKYYTSNIEDGLTDEHWGVLLNDLYRIMCFIYFADIKEKLLAANVKSKLNFYTEIQNDTKQDFIWVNANWTVKSIRTEGFPVRGFWRLQPCGKGRTELRLVFVNPFEKHGYVRRSGKEIHENNKNKQNEKNQTKQ